MAEPQRGIGRGLAAILSVEAAEHPPEELRHVPVELISPNPSQPRQEFDPEALASLADSIRARGVLQPVLVRQRPGGTYELIAGERRWRAAALAGLETVPALVTRHEPGASLEVALIENMAREDLNPIEEAKACAALIEEVGLSREEVAVRIGRSRVAVANLIRLLDLPDEVLQALERGELTEGHGRALLLAEDHATRRALAREAIARGWSVRALERQARAAKARPRSRASARRRRELHPDQAAAIEQITDALGEVAGAELEVTASGRHYTVHLTFDSPEAAIDLARRLRVKSAGPVEARAG